MAFQASMMPPTEVPTRARYWVVFFAITLSILAYVDRVCIAQAAPRIMEDLNFTKVEMGYIFSAFALAYALFEIPGGWMGDYMGPRKVLMRIVLWWSFFTAATGWAIGLKSMWVTRFLFGAGEAGCFPNLTKAFTTWLPQHERVRAQGIMWTFARWGGAFTPPLVVLAFQYMSWRTAFELFGVLGLVWAFFFYRWFRDNPADHKSVNKAELALIDTQGVAGVSHGNVPWRRLATSRTVWMLWVQYIAMCFPWYFYITWLPTYLQDHRGLTQAQSANYAIFPLLFGGFGCLLCGMISARVARSFGSVRKARRFLAIVGFLGAAAFLFVSIQIANPLWAMLAMGMASFCNDLVMPGAWGACMDVGGKYAGTLAGSMNMMGNVAGFVAPVAGGYIIASSNLGWNTFLYLMASVYLIGAFCWPLIDPVTPIDKDLEGAPAH